MALKNLTVFLQLDQGEKILENIKLVHCINLKMRFFLEFSYSGTNYHGCQRQPNAISVQEVIENSLKTILRDSISLTAAGRTDTGVHAKQMFAHFDAKINKERISNLVYELNQFLPLDIVIK